MPSPLYDAISVRLSRRVGDPVAAAATDGKKYTSALRDTYLNAAIKKIYLKNLIKTDPDGLRYAMLDTSLFRGVLTDEGQALSANTKALTGWTGTAAYIISAKNTTTSTVVYPIPQRLKSVIEIGAGPYLSGSTTNQFYSIEGVNLKVYGSGATDTINLQYIKSHVTLSAGGSTDILVPAEYYEQILDLAEALALQEFPTQSNISRAASKEAQVNKEIYG